MSRRSIALAGTLLVGAFTAAHGQLVTPKTVPVQQDEQFAVFPSLRAGMAGLSIALDDSLTDPFVNPAKAFMGGRGMMISAPFNHNITGGHGGGRTLPLGGMGSRGQWAGSFLVAWQDLDNSASSNALNIGASDNRYVQVGVARRWSSDLTFGVSAYAARLHAIDGFDILYDGSDGIAQKGSLTDIRLGATKHWGDKRLDLLVLKNRTDITNAVAYSSAKYNWHTQATDYTSWVEHDLDRTNTWGAHVQYAQPMGDGWRLGWLATANRLSHPKIPNYNIKNTPTVRWDPGTTYAFDFGVGVARTMGLTTFGVDFIREPMTSNTWGNAQTDIPTADGGVLRAGEHTVDNHFNFSNSKVRLGLAQDLARSADGSSMLGLQVGLAVTGVSYDLEQHDRVSQTSRSQSESWHEWTPTFGARLKLGGVNVQYNYRLTCSRECFPLAMGDKVTVPPAVGIIAAPTRAVSVDGGTSRVHQVVVAVPIR